jgi:hypothetical protein
MIYKLTKWYYKDKNWIEENTDMSDFLDYSLWLKYENYCEYKQSQN